MKSRIFCLIAIIFLGVGLVALLLTTINNPIPEQLQVDQNNLVRAIVRSPEPENRTGSGDPFMQPVIDKSDAAFSHQTVDNSSDITQTIHNKYTTIPWSPPLQYQTPENRSNEVQIPPDVSPPDQSQSPGEVQQVGDYVSPAGRAGSLAGTESKAVLPVVSRPVDSVAAPSSRTSTESIQPPPLGVSVDMAYDIIFGYLDPGDMVTATALGGSAFGSAQADATGYFFTPFWGTDGRQVDLVGGETIEIYVNGTYLESITTHIFTGEMKVDTDQVMGNLAGLSSGDVVTLSLGIWGYEPNSETPWVTTTTDTNGDFIANFTADLGPSEFARIETSAGNGRVYHYVYPNTTFGVDTFNYIFGYWKPYQLVTVTVYEGTSITVRGTQTVKGNWPHGDYSAALLVVPGDTVKVDQAGGSIYSLITSNLTAVPDLVNNQVTGQAPASQKVRVFIYNVLLGVYTETITTADISGAYTATFPDYDLTAQDAFYPAYAGEGGSEVLLSVFPPRIQVFPDMDQVIGNGDAPQIPFTYTVTHAGQNFTIPGKTDFLNGTGWADFSSLGVDIIAGDLITLETSSWKGSMIVADLSMVADTANDCYQGITDQSGEVTVVSFPWPAWVNPVYKFDSGTKATSNSFNICLPGQDVRAGVSGRLIHNDDNYFATRKNFEVRYFDLDLPWGVSSPQYKSDEVITATLYYSDQVTVKDQVSKDNDSNPDYYWLGFNGEIAAGDWMSVTNGSDWGAWLQVPDLSISVDRQTDLISGTTPETLLYVEGGNNQNWFGVWAPSYADGAEHRYGVNASSFGVDMDFGSGATVYYQALNGNRARHSFSFPNLTARYNPDGSSSMFGNNGIPGNTIYITVTNSIDDIVASGQTSAGTGWMGPTSYNLDFSKYRLTPGDLIHIDFGSGFTDTLPIVELTAQADIDHNLVTGLAPANSQLNAVIRDVLGNSNKLDQIQVSSSGTYTLDFGSIGWETNNGDNISVYYPAWHGHQIEYSFRLPAPNLNLGLYNTNGGAQPGGPYAYGVWVSNDGELAAQDVQVVLTLPPSTTLLGDTSEIIPQIGANGVVTWSLGTLAPNEQHNYFMTVLLDPGHSTGDGALAPLCGDISTSTSGDSDPNNNHSCSGNAFVQIEDIDIRVDKWPNPGDVVAGQEFVYDIQYCNDRNSAAGPVWLTDTLPTSTTFISLTPRNWWGEVFWSQQSLNNGVLALYFPSIPGNNCTDLDLRLRADDSLPLNTTLSNLVQVYTAGDSNTNNNWRRNEDARISIPRPELGLDKLFDNGTLVPGGELSYRLNYYNSGNITLHGYITDTLPAGTEYVVGSAYDNGQPATPILITAGQVVWDLGEINVNRGSGLTYRLSILESVSPDTELLNCATIGHSDVEGTPADNTACDKRTVQDHGPNLEVEKVHQWNGDGWLHYEISFRNLGDQDEYGVIITDTYPLSTTFGGWGYNYF